MKLVTLIENTAPQGLTAEHGLSLYLETLGQRILFDAGQSCAFAENARALGIDLTRVDACVLSHGHYDHGGGLETFLQINRTAPVYVSPFAFEQHCNASGRDIGIKDTLPKERLRFVTERQEIAPHITLVTLPGLPADSGGMTAQGRPEDFRHEQYLLVEEGPKRILISGCSHKGILQIADAFRPDVLVGGFHFMNIQEEACLTAAARQLLAFPTRYYTGHCTGQAQFAILKQQMGSRLQAFQTGSVWTL